MPQISLLAPTVLNGFIRERPFPQQLLGLGIMGRPKAWPFPYWKYDIVRGNNTMTKLNVPGQEAHLRGRLGLRQLTGAFLYMRDKKQFDPVTTYWLREPGDIARGNAERMVRQEVAELDDAQNFFLEWAFWQPLTAGTYGKLSVRRYDSPPVEINYGFNAAHNVVPSVLWSDLANANIASNLASWRQMIINDSGFTPTTIYLNSATFTDYVIPNAKMQGMWPDSFKEQYLNNLTIRGLYGFDWVQYDNQYVDDWTTPGVQTSAYYIPKGKMVMLAPQGGGIGPIGALEGPSADHDALRQNANWTGKFAKSWLDNDPSNRTHLQEWSVVPTYERPDNLLVADVD